jgi:phosphatidylglycerophosphatase A
MTRLARAIATAVGAGYSPVAPGTCGTAVAVPLAWLAADLGIPGFAALTALTIAVGIWAAGAADRSWGTHDSGRIVIDEVAGYFVTVALVERGDPLTLGVGFVVFRALDILKPPPVRAIDRRVGGGAGVVLDDVAAGVLGGAVMVGLALAGAVAAPAWLAALRS